MRRINPILSPYLRYVLAVEVSLRPPKIIQHGALSMLTQEYILGVDIFVDDTLPMQVYQSVQNIKPESESDRSSGSTRSGPLKASSSNV